MLVTMTAAAGLVFPFATLVIIIVNCFARPLYMWMYLTYGPNYRKLGAIAGQLPLNIVSIASVAKLCYNIFALKEVEALV